MYVTDDCIVMVKIFKKKLFFWVRRYLHEKNVLLSKRSAMYQRSFESRDHTGVPLGKPLTCESPLT